MCAILRPGWFCVGGFVYSPPMATNTAKNHEIYVCSHCGATSVQWLGNCPKCGQWNTYAPEARTGSPVTGQVQSTGLKAVPLAEACEETAQPFSCGHPALDHLLGAGLVPGSVLLLGGEPGIGKSTLLLQVCLAESQALANPPCSFRWQEGWQKKAERCSTPQARKRLPRYGPGPSA